MNITQAKGYVRDTMRAYLLTDDEGLRLVEPRLQRPLFLVGPPGIGKTAIMEQVADELGIGLVAYSMTHHTRQSALGLPVIEHHAYKDLEYDASEYTMSEIIASIYAYMERTGLEQGILFLDEVNCVSETLYPSMLQFLQFKTFGAHAVPGGWIIACAGNPPEYNRSVHEFDVATMDRLRKIEVEPDLAAWKAYAAGAGVHACVTTFLEAQPDCFYRIQKTPDGMSFVTARGWDDLARMITLNERLGIAVDQELVGQFVQDAEVAEKFALYYDLFSKYRSDYQIPAILAGEAPREIVERAGSAQLDERMALLGLLVDTLAPQADDVMVQEGVLQGARDVLRSIKEPLLQGAAAGESLEPAIARLADEERRREAAGLRKGAQARSVRRKRALLKSCRDACAKVGLTSGPEAFEVVHQEFRGHVGAFEAQVSDLRAKLEHAFDFLGNAFADDRETLLFATELAARKSFALFIARYGCDGFTRANQQLQTASRRSDLLERMEAVEATHGGALPNPANDARAFQTYDGASPAKSAAATKPQKPSSAGSARRAPAWPDAGDEAVAYYDQARWEFGYASLCHITPPANLEGKTLLDVGCRRGKGVFKFSERVGARGHVIGVDWVPEHIDEARKRSERAALDSGLPTSNMEFHCAFPEDLMAAGIGSSTVDVAFVNSVLHLMWRPDEALAEMRRVLKPGGLLVLEIALASAPRDAGVVEAARTLGNSIQAAPFRGDFERRLDELGFDVSIAVDPRPVQPDEGYKRDHKVPCAPRSEDVRFEALVLHARKR